MCVSWQEVVGKASNSRVFYVTDNNADPTGYYDSTRALQATINQAFNVPTHRELLPGIPDLGGVEIHLEGGDYLISSPLQFPSKGGGNLVVCSSPIIIMFKFLLFFMLPVASYDVLALFLQMSRITIVPWVLDRPLDMGPIIYTCNAQCV
jgi:hypothetical protein